jgi:hypothetical protein
MCRNAFVAKTQQISLNRSLGVAEKYPLKIRLSGFFIYFLLSLLDKEKRQIV